jgi:hypothetical protein
MPEQERALSQYAPWLVAIVAIAIFTTAFLYLTKEPPSASGEITKVFALQQPGTERVLVGIEVRIKNETEKELLVRGVNTNIRIGEQEFVDTPAAAAEHARYFRAFPEFKQSDAPPLAFETKIPPQGEIIGLAIVSYPVPKHIFDTRSSTRVSISLYGRKPLVLTR